MHPDLKFKIRLLLLLCIVAPRTTTTTIAAASCKAKQFINCTRSRCDRKTCADQFATAHYLVDDADDDVPIMVNFQTFAWELLRRTIVTSRTYGIPKNLYGYLFLLTNI